MPQSSVTAVRPLVLVVEQDPSRSGPVWTALSAEAELVSAATFAEAAARLEQSPGPGLIVLVACDGAEVEAACGALRDESASFIPVLVLLPETGREERRRALAAGAIDCLFEPLDPEDLRLRARELLRLRARWLKREGEMARLREVAELKDDLVALILHDLRNPLAGVFGYLSALDLATRERRNLDLREDVEGAMASARKVNEVLGEMLEIRMLEEGGLPLRREHTALSGLGAAALSSLEGAARERGVFLALETDPLAMALLDQRLVRRALENLMSNALRYSPAGSTIAIHLSAEPGGARLAVADSGPGIPDELKDSVFNKFATVEGARGQVRRGFGLGLYQVRLVVVALGGTARVRDREGGGAIVELWLPDA